jgi:hypothetical protein
MNSLCSLFAVEHNPHFARTVPHVHSVRFAFGYTSGLVAARNSEGVMP